MAARRLLVAVGGGGFLWETRMLLAKLEGEYAFRYLVPEDTSIAAAGLPPGDVVKVPYVRDRGEPWPRSLWRVVRIAFGALREIVRFRPDSLLCVGASLALPLFATGKLCRVPTVFVESVTRVAKLSDTGLWLLKLRLCDRFYVQWPRQAEIDPRCVYRGTVL